MRASDVRLTVCAVLGAILLVSSVLVFPRPGVRRRVSPPHRGGSVRLPREGGYRVDGGRPPAAAGVAPDGAGRRRRPASSRAGGKSPEESGPGGEVPAPAPGDGLQARQGVQHRRHRDRPRRREERRGRSSPPRRRKTTSSRSWGSSRARSRRSCSASRERSGPCPRLPPRGPGAAPVVAPRDRRRRRRAASAAGGPAAAARPRSGPDHARRRMDARLP